MSELFYILLSVHLSIYCVCSAIFCDSAALLSVCSLTREDFARAPSDGDQILDQVLAVGGLAAAGLAQQHNGLILTGGKQVAVRRLSHGVDMRSRVLAPAAFEHVHHLMGEEKIGTAGEENNLYL